MQTNIIIDHREFVSSELLCEAVIDKDKDINKINNIFHYQLNKKLSTKFEEVKRELSIPINTLLITSFSVLVSRFLREEKVAFLANNLPLTANLNWDNPISELIECFSNNNFDFPQKSDIKSKIAFHYCEDDNFELYDYKNIDFLFIITRINALGDFKITIKNSNSKFCERFVKLFEKISEQILSNFNSKILNIDLELTEETNLLLNDWGCGKKINIVDKTLTEIFELNVLKKPNKIAVITKNENYSYDDLNKQANKLARYLEIKGITREDCVGLCMARSFEAIVSILAIMKIGAIYIPIDPSFPDERKIYIYEDSGCKYIICDDKNSFKSFNKELLIEFAKIKHKLDILDSSNLEVKKCIDDLAYVIYTSGSTGNPKGVMIKHCSIVNFSREMGKHFIIEEQDVILQFAAFSFDVSIFEIFSPLINECSMAIVPDSYKKLPRKLVEFMEKNNVSIAELPPSYLPLLNPRELPTLRLLSVGGEKFPGYLVSEWLSPKRAFINGYGPTEATVAVTLHSCANKKYYRNPPIGKPIANTNVYVLDENLKFLPIGAVGELYISGICLAAKYINLPIETKKNFINNPYSNDKFHSILYKTGDLVRWLEDGVLEIIGRVDRQIKVNGFRVEPGEIESKIKINKLAKQAVITSENNIIKLFLVEPNFEETTIKEKLKVILPSYMIPHKILVLDEFPITNNGKIDFNILAKL